MKSRVVVTTIIEYNGKILLGEKPYNKGPYPNTWHLPGGGVDLENESIYEAVKREIKEETGLEVTDITRVSFDEDYEPDKRGEMTHYLFLVFTVRALSNKAKAADDLVTLKWFDKDALKHIALTRPTIKYFKEIGWL